MSEFGNRSGEGQDGFSFVPNFGGMNFGESLDETSQQDARDGSTDFSIELHEDYLQEDPYIRFKREYKNQEIDLHPRLEDSSVLSEHCFSRNEIAINTTVATAGRILRENPEERLANKPINLPSEHDIPQHEVALETLEGMINSSIERPPEEKLPPYQFESHKIPAVDMCADAELYFDRAIPGGWAWLPRANKEVEYQAIVDESEDGLNIVAVRKFEGKPSVLALEDMAVDGVVYPAGSLMRFQLASDGPQEKKYFEWTHEHPPRIVSYNEVLRGGFLRLSNDFIGQPEKIAHYRKRVENDLRRLGEI
jgi:hypothetical protein